MVGILITKRSTRRAGILCVAMMLSAMQVYPAFAATECVEMMCEPTPVAEPAQQVPTCHAVATEESQPTQNANDIRYGTERTKACCSMDMAAPPYYAYASKSHETRTTTKHLSGWVSGYAVAQTGSAFVEIYARALDESPPGEIRLYLSNASFLL